MSIKTTSDFDFKPVHCEAVPLALGTRALGGWKKRAFDIVFGVTALIMLLPLFILVALAVKSYDRGPMFYRHRRVGVRQSQFPCLKFRTMRQDSEAALTAYLRDNLEAQQEWIQARKLKQDPRVTPIGVFLRKTSLDELPQVINIIAGHMSVVGPRPIVADEVALYGSDARSYFATRPGLTGLWQVSGRSDTTYDERIRLDKSYVENWSLLADMAIILRTIPAVFMSRGSY